MSEKIIFTNPTFSFTVPGPIPSVNHVYKRRGLKPGETFKGRGRGMFMSEEGRDFKQWVGWSALIASRKVNLALNDSHFFEVNLTLHRGKTWRETLRRDDDNVIKLTIDAMQGVVYGNDSVVISKLIRKRPAFQGDERLEVEVIRLFPIPDKGSEEDKSYGR